MAELLAFLPLLRADEDATQPRPATSTPEPPDATARARALDIESSWIVEAPAGSGKTGLLMQRLLKLLAFAPLTRPEEVLGITFTRKATAELRERLIQELHGAQKGSPTFPETAFGRQTRAFAEAALRRDRELGWNLLDHPERLNIRTIDSVCGEIARTLPLLSGSGGAREPVDNASDLYRTAALRTLQQLGGADPVLNHALGVLLLRRDAHLGNCTTLIAGMLGNREQWGRLLPLKPNELSDTWLEQHVRPRLERALEEAVCSALSHARRQMPAGFLEELTAIAERSALAEGYKGPSPIAFCAGRHEPPGERAEDLEHWIALVTLLLTKEGDWRSPAGLAANHLRFKADREELDRLRRLLNAHREDSTLEQALCAVRQIPPATYPEEQWIAIKALFRILRHAMIELKLLFTERGQCDFSEMSLAAREVLSTEDGATDLAEAAGLRFRHLLVDEMQDTSHSQYDLLEQLIRGWGGEAETVFLVGDPKQSIYLFRQARVERFLRTFRDGRLGDFPIAPLRLTANFRTQSGLVERFNDMFSAIFPPETQGREAPAVPFVRAAAIRDWNPRAGLRWHARVFDTPADPAEARSAVLERRRAEARSLRHAIEQWQATPLPKGRKKPWRLAVLARQRDHLVPLVAELNRTDEGPSIPYRAVEIDPLASRTEILDLVALTRALLHPADRIAWLAVLRAPWCGVGRADLLALTGEGSTADAETPVTDLVASRAQYLSSEGNALLARCWPVLTEAVASLGRTPLATHLERTWRSLGGDAVLPPEALKNAATFFRVLRLVEREGEGRVDVAKLKEHLKRLYAEPNAASGAVELLTIHKSKGLEWDVVFVPGLERQSPNVPTHLLNWVELDSGDPEIAPAVLAPIYGKGESSDRLNDWIRGVRRGRELAETKRLLYVASTRAREELHLFGACPRDRNGGVTAPHTSSMLAAAWPAAQSVFDAANTSEAWATDLRTPTLLPFPKELAGDGAPASEELALAAAADFSPVAELETRRRPTPLLRLPLGFDPLGRFLRRPEECLPHPPASAAALKPLLERPEGSFAARGFGNVVHRFLGQVAGLLAAGVPFRDVQAQVAEWRARLEGSLRSEGIAPVLAAREADRVQRALLLALEDHHGRWILGPHPESADECALTSRDTAVGSLRVDRTYVAGSTPLSIGADTIWIVDFKTAEPGGRNQDTFLAEERAKYQAQLEAYATVRRALPGGSRPIRLALYYPLLPYLIHWESESKQPPI